ncbi:MAG TPA: RluA family pseudouridine synthase [Polyangiaceae bacterium]|nr:RluA family pseudouridine synthase [Polyangiaceae bacterium]
MVEPAARWVEPRGGQRRLGAVLRALGVSDQALVSGAVFVNRVRQTRPDQLVCADDVVEVYPMHRGSEPRCEVVERRGDLLLIDKPAALASEPTRLGGGGSVTEQLAAVLGTRVHVHSRLDVGVSGLVLVALGERARAHIERLRSHGAYHRHYLALASGAPPDDAGVWHGKLGKGRDARDAETAYRVVERVTHAGAPRSLALLALAPITGRTHQLRLQAAAAGAPILGDKRYRGVHRVIADDGSVIGLTRIMLHAARVELTDVDGQPWRVVLPPPYEVTNLWTMVGGSSESVAAACSESVLANSRLGG